MHSEVDCPSCPTQQHSQASTGQRDIQADAEVSSQRYCTCIYGCRACEVDATLSFSLEAVALLVCLL